MIVVDLDERGFASVHERACVADRNGLIAGAVNDADIAAKRGALKRTTDALGDQFVRRTEEHGGPLPSAETKQFECDCTAVGGAEDNVDCVLAQCCSLDVDALLKCARDDHADAEGCAHEDEKRCGDCTEQADAEANDHCDGRDHEKRDRGGLSQHAALTAGHGLCDDFESGVTQRADLSTLRTRLQAVYEEHAKRCRHEATLAHTRSECRRVVSPTLQL